MSKKKLDQLILQTSIVFKSYDHNVIKSKTKSNLWHFSSSHKKNKYNIYCTLDINKVKSLIKIANKKTADGTRLIVVCTSYSEIDKEASLIDNYCVIDFESLKSFGVDILEARAKEAQLLSPRS